MKCRGHLKLELGIYLGFACLPVGREFGIWNFETYTRHGRRGDDVFEM
jgi:hypothetical protein